MDALSLENTLGAIRRANLRGRLYPHPPQIERCCALHRLMVEGWIARVPPTRTCLGGWFAHPEPTDCAIVVS